MRMIYVTSWIEVYVRKPLLVICSLYVFLRYTFEEISLVPYT